jgi:hypothetical protein
MLRGAHAAALVLLDTDEGAGVGSGLVSHAGSLARAHNGLGNHVPARDVCLHAMSFLSPEYVRVGRAGPSVGDPGVETRVEGVAELEPS